ncbi:MAG: DNA polymerase III subunit delta' [Bacillota bacterium]|nr:DNA polymerase III subunit delta' [Bacillota bacterium]
MRFADFTGQERIKNLLRNAVAQGRVAQTYLFAGPPGVGKRALALALAQALNCLSPQGEDSCGTCPSCRRVEGGNHPDVLLVEPGGGALKIDQMRWLQQEAALRPYAGRRRVFILEGAETLTDQAANSLLKLLEEPPPSAVLILLAVAPERLLPTVRSRCLTVYFYPWPKDRLILELRRQGVPAAEAAALAEIAGGSPGQALALRPLLPQIQGAVEALVQAAHRRDDRALLAAAQELASREEMVLPVLNGLAAHGRRLLQEGGPGAGRWAGVLRATLEVQRFLERGVSPLYALAVFALQVRRALQAEELLPVGVAVEKEER